MIVFSITQFSTNKMDRKYASKLKKEGEINGRTILLEHLINEAVVTLIVIGLLFHQPNIQSENSQNNTCLKCLK